MTPVIIELAERAPSRPTLGLHPRLLAQRPDSVDLSRHDAPQAEVLGSEILMKGADSLEIIESYPDDKYLPSFLLRGEVESRVFHVQIATDVQGANVRIVTMYTPAPEEWDSEFRVRKVQL